MSQLVVRVKETVERYQPKYFDYVKTDEATLAEFRKNGRLRTASDELKLDEKVKNSYLLQYAMKNPAEYIKERNKLLEDAKDAINQTFLQTFNRFNGMLPPSDLRDLSLQAAEDQMKIQLEAIEAQLPSDFAMQSYRNALQKEVARNFSNVGGVAPTV